MTPFKELLKSDRKMRLFLTAHAQSSLGTGAGYVALLVLAYERFPSPWAITLILLADFFPGMLLGPVFGAVADRWPRRSCAVVADLARAIAFVGIALVGDFGATLAFALLAGVGTALFRPATMAGLPSLVEGSRLPAATSLYGALDDLGHTVGPLLAAVGLAVASPATLLAGNGLTFAISAILLTRVPFGRVRERRAGPRGSVLREAREGISETLRSRGISAVVLSSSAVILFAGLFNVGELLLATQVLHIGASGFSLLVAVFGVGVVAGSLTGSRGGTLANLKHRYLIGLAVVGLSFLMAGLAPTFGTALVGFALSGLGNGLVVVHERLLLQQVVPDTHLGRVFGVKTSLTAWAFATAFVSGGAIASVFGTRPLFVVAGVGVLATFTAASLALRDVWSDEPSAAAAPGLPRLAAS